MKRFSSAVASATVSESVLELRRAETARRRRVEVTSSTLEPSASICFLTADEEPVPTAISTITEPTPIIRPRIVSPERSLLAASPESATRIVSVMPPLASGSGAGSSSTIRPSRMWITRSACAATSCLVGDQDDRAALAAEPLEDPQHLARWTRCRGCRSARRRGSSPGW